jgi:glutamine synthetase
MIRIPRFSPGHETSTRAELRFPDPSCNPYLAFAVMLAAGLDGIERGLQPPAPLNQVNLYELDAEQLAARGVQQLPGSLSEALGELAGDKVLRNALGEEAYLAFARAKASEWQTFQARVTDWEVETYLEVA